MEQILPVGKANLILKQGDITQEEVDAIVNAANSGLLGGGGVDGAIHAAGGPAILEECKKIIEKQKECPTGEAVITTAGNLKAKYVIHTVGPVWHGGSQSEDELLHDAYQNSLKLAEEHGVKTIAFPSISTGAYAFPIDRAASTALTTIKEFLEEPNGLEEVRMILFSEADFKTYKNALDTLL